MEQGASTWLTYGSLAMSKEVGSPVMLEADCRSGLLYRAHNFDDDSFYGDISS